jgi:hypothetical protein
MSVESGPTRRHGKPKDLYSDEAFTPEINHDTTLLFRIVIAIGALVSMLIFLPSLLAWAGYEGAVHHVRRKSMRVTR